MNSQIGIGTMMLVVIATRTASSVCACRSEKCLPDTFTPDRFDENR